MRALVLLLLLCSLANAQTVRYGGRIYRGNAVCCNNRSCGMRASILGMRRQLSLQRIISTQQTGYKKVWKCVNGICGWYTEPITVQQAIPLLANTTTAPMIRHAASPSVQSKNTTVRGTVQACQGYTPHDVIASIFSVVKPRRGATWIDVGSGDGRVVIAAAKAGCNAIGLEISQSRVASSRSAIESAGSKVLCMDATEYDYRYADYVFLYQHAPIIAKVVAKLRPYSTIISYQHRIPGMQNRVFKRASDGATFYVAVKPDNETFQEVTQ